MHNSSVSVNNVRFAFLHCSCEWILILYAVKDFNGQFQTGREPLVAILIFQVMSLRSTFFNLNSNITIISFLRSIPRITDADECPNFSKALKPSQMLLFDPLFYLGGCDVCGGTNATNPLKTKRIYITFTSYVRGMLETTCFAL